MKYTLYYKTPGMLFWHKLKKVRGDSIIWLSSRPVDKSQGMINEIAVRVIELEDRTRIEIPVEGIIIKYSKERFFFIKEKVEQEAGQKIPIKE